MHTYRHDSQTNMCINGFHPKMLCKDILIKLFLSQLQTKGYINVVLCVLLVFLSSFFTIALPVCLGLISLNVFLLSSASLNVYSLLGLLFISQVEVSMKLVSIKLFLIKHLNYLLTKTLCRKSVILLTCLYFSIFLFKIDRLIDFWCFTPLSALSSKFNSRFNLTVVLSGE